MYTPEDSPFEKFRKEKLKGVAMSPDVRELVALAYESGFIDGMQKQMQSSVDRAVNGMAEQPAQQEPVAQEWRYYFSHSGATGKPDEVVGPCFTDRKEVAFGVGCFDQTAFYPPASKPWVGLTDVERIELMEKTHPKNRWPLLALCEDKLREKNA